MRAIATWVSLTLTFAALPATAQLAEEPAADPAPAPAEPPPTAAEIDAVSPSELEALRVEVRELRERVEEAETATFATEAEPVSPTLNPLRVYGFMDFGFDKFFLTDPDDDNFALLRPTPAGTFVFGNLNLYFDARPVEDLHAMVEIRLSLAPHGEEVDLGPPLGTSYERIDALAFDFSSPSLQSQLRLGSIYIERAYTEYTFSQLFKLQWGLFLTPFGIWNLDHGSPTLISLMLPSFIASQMVPTRLLGLNLYGTALLGTVELGYAINVSNGRSPLDVDLTEDKAAGLRFYFAKEVARLRWVLGTSGYLGHYSDKSKRVTGRVIGNVIDWVDEVAYLEGVLGVDAALDLGDLRLRSEAVFRWVRYEDGKHERLFSPDGRVAYTPSRFEYDVYAILAYRTPWRLEPYLSAEFLNKSYVLPRFAGQARATQTGTFVFGLSVGLNVELTSHTLFKTQVVWLKAHDTVDDVTVADLPILFMRVVSSF